MAGRLYRWSAQGQPLLSHAVLFLERELRLAGSVATEELDVGERVFACI